MRKARGSSECQKKCLPYGPAARSPPPFGDQIQEERVFGGYTIPSKVSVGWRLGTDHYFEFFRARIEDAVFR